MRHSPVYKKDDISVGDTVYIWRDASGWIVSARVTMVLHRVSGKLFLFTIRVTC